MSMLGRWKSLAVAIFGAALASCAVAGLQGTLLQAQTPVAHLDETRLPGSWYEIARLPNKAEKRCESDAVELIARWDKPGSLEWVDSCTVAKHYTTSRTLYAHPVPKRKKQTETAGDGRYKVYTIFPFSRKYDVLGIAKDNSWLLVGTPNHKEVWIYAKDPAMPPPVYAVVQQLAASQGYAVDKLVLGKQSKANPDKPAVGAETVVP
jgi:apolipoprotein D and lipocalin family protein